MDNNISTYSWMFLLSRGIILYIVYYIQIKSFRSVITGITYLCHIIYVFEYTEIFYT